MTFRSWIATVLGARSRAFSSSPAGRRAGTRRRSRWQPTIEFLEDRLVPAHFTVTNTSDNINDPGSIRYDFAHLDHGALNSVDFDPSLAGQTITLTNGELQIPQDLTVVGPFSGKPVAISGNSASRVF